jgi:glutathionylspermidine synthase
MYPHHANLLEARWTEPEAGRVWVRKPLLGRENANVTLHLSGQDFETTGEYGVNADISKHGIVVRIRYGRRFPIRCPFRISPEASFAVTSI